MFDEGELPQISNGIPKNLECLSVDELSQYITELKTEINRAEKDIKNKKAHQDAAAQLFL